MCVRGAHNYLNYTLKVVIFELNSLIIMKYTLHLQALVGIRKLSEYDSTRLLTLYSRYCKNVWHEALKSEQKQTGSSGRAWVQRKIIQLKIRIY